MRLSTLSRRFALVPGLFFLALLLAASPAHATQPAPVPELMTPGELQEWLDGGPDTRVLPESLGPWNYVREFDQMVGFFAEWQLLDPESTNYGGMIEAESGPLGNVIQTDNTLEAIWCWSRYREFSGRDTYDPNIEAAWIYCRQFPAWSEEGSVGDDYYRVHNCAWGLTAALQYEAATGDVSYAGYADTCAQYIGTHSLPINGTTNQQRLRAFVKGWAAGNLYLYGEATSDPLLRLAAVSQGNNVKSWLDVNPTVNLAAEYWAMSSGTAVWGVCNSVFRDDPAQGMTWCAANAPLMDVWQEWYNVPGYDWDSSWNVAYCNAHFAVWDVTGDEIYRENGEYIADLLLSLDTDDDGGIVASTQDPVTEDMSWVSCYLVMMGVDRLMGTPVDHDVGVLRFADIDEGEAWLVGVPITVAARATNFGLTDEVAINVHLDGAAGTAMETVDLPFVALEDVTLVEEWIPTTPGLYTLSAWTSLPGDANTANDTVTVTINILPSTAIDHGSEPLALLPAPRAYPNPSRASVLISFRLEDDAPVALRVFDAAGRLVGRMQHDWLAAGQRQLAWDGHDANGRAAAPGVYFYRLEAGAQVRTGKIIRLE